MSPNFLLIIFCLVLGNLLRWTGKFPKNAPQAFNGFVIWISLPAVVLLQVPVLFSETQLNPEILIPISMSWILFTLSFVTFYFIGQKLKWSKPETGALILTAGLGNTSFVGFPLLESFFGQAGVQIGVLVDQPGTFLVLSILGLITASLYSPTEGRAVKPSAIAKRIFTFPPFIALIIAILWYFSGTYEKGILTSVLERFASTLVPLALVAVGFQLNFSRAVLKRQWKPLSLGLGFKLILAPLFFFALYVLILEIKTLPVRVAIIEAAMAPMITAAVVAEEFELNSEIASLMVGVGIPLSIATVYFWNEILSHFF